eukprot:2924951-Pleurochrysis_carterae.AAC.1
MPFPHWIEPVLTPHKRRLSSPEVAYLNMLNPASCSAPQLSVRECMHSSRATNQLRRSFVIGVRRIERLYMLPEGSWWLQEAL